MNNSRLKTIIFSLLSLVVLTGTLYIALSGTKKSTEIRSKAAGTDSADVIVVGAGTGGVAAAIQAARGGATVILLEESDWIGGQMTAAGVTSMDGGDPRWTGGIYKEFIDKVRQYYQAKGKSINTCYYGDAGAVCFEPSVGKSILEQMIASQASISLQLQSQVLSVQKSGNTVTGLIVKQGTSTRTLTAKVVIDATEYGDLLPMTGVTYRAGNSTSTSLNQNACIQNITYTAVFKKYPSGVPNELKITTPPPGYTDEVKNKFAIFVTNNGTSPPYIVPQNWANHNAYRGMPDSSNPANYDGLNPAAITKTGVNWANDWPVNVKYLQDKTYRKQINCEAKLHTIQFIYYVQTELGETLWSVANDEGYDTPYNREDNDCPNIPASLKSIEHNMPVIPYVRESRRAVGSMTLAAKNIKRIGSPPVGASSFTSSVAVGDYPDDLHGCNANENFEADLQETSVDAPAGFISGPFQIPFEAFIPINIDNFIVAEKNLSQSRLANGATRLQPITMLTGQAAGALAALSTQQNKPPRLVDIRQVQKILTQAKASIVPFTDVPIDNPMFPFIQQIAAWGLMIGSGVLQFSPDGLLIRAQAAVVFLRAIHGVGYAPPTVTTSAFTDVPLSNPYVHWINQFAAEGITGGCGTGTFCPDNPVTRAQIAVFLLKAKYGAGFTPPAVGASTGFSDVPINHWAAAWIKQLVAEGITSGCGSGIYCPDANVTRATFTAFASVAFPQSLIASIPIPILLTPINGACAATHYNCTAGVLGDYKEYTNEWQWWCMGSNGGTNILCAENKPVTPNIPYGWQDNISCSAISGWACDADDYNTPLAIHFYADPSYTTFLGSTTAGNSRTDLVTSGNCGSTPNHGFSFTTPMSLKDGLPHTIYAYAINIGPAGQNPLLSGSPKTITCTAPTPAPPTGLTVSCPSPGATATFSWNPVAGIDYYAIRINNQIDGWSGTCAAPDTCANVWGTTYTLTTVPSHTYNWFIQTVKGSQWSDPATGDNFVCNKPSSTPTPTLVQKQGDANKDKKVDGIDYVAWFTYYNQTITIGPTGGDFNSSGKVDGVDYVLWANNYGK